MVCVRLHEHPPLIAAGLFTEILHLIFASVHILNNTSAVSCSQAALWALLSFPLTCFFSPFFLGFANPIQSFALSSLRFVMEHPESWKDLQLFFEGRCRLTLVGKTGAGKSATGNTILGRNTFKTQTGDNPETKICGVASSVRNGPEILVMDTPGLSGTDGEDYQITKMISQSMFGVAPGPHAILLVLRLDTTSCDGEIKVFQILKTLFGPKMTSHLIVIFAGKDQLEKTGVDFEQQLERSDKLKGLLQETGHRYLLFNNMADDDEKTKQMKQLLLLVKEVVIQNGGGCFLQSPRQLSEADKEVFPDGRCRLIVIGKTGSGKSATGNTILGQEKFKSQIGVNSETKSCGVAETVRNGLEILVMDSPGLCDTDGDDTEIHRQITKSLFAVAPGPHAVILVLRCDHRFTDQEIKVFETLKHIFGPHMTSYIIIIFTGKDQLDKNGVDFEEQLKKADKLKGLLLEASNRYLLFNNEADDDEKAKQVEQLMLVVKSIVKENNGTCFRHWLSHELNQTKENMMKEEIRELQQNEKALAPEGTPLKETESKEEERASCFTSDDDTKEKAEADEEGTTHAEQQAIRRKQEVKEVKKRGQVKSVLMRLEPPSPEPAPDKKPLHLWHGTQQKGFESKKSLAGKLKSTKDSEKIVSDVVSLGMESLAEDSLMRKVVDHPEELKDVQKEELNKAVKSVGGKIKEGKIRFSVKNIDKCHLM